MSFNDEFVEKYPASAAWQEGQEWTEGHVEEVIDYLRSQYAEGCKTVKNTAVIEPERAEDPQDAATIAEFNGNNLRIHQHSDTQCERIREMIHDLKRGHFDGYCMTCGSVIINPQRVMLSASHECTACKEVHEVRDRGYVNRSGGYAHVS